MRPIALALVLILAGATAMADTHYFVRTLLPGGGWDIDHPDRVDGGGKQIYLATEIQAVLPGKQFVVRCKGALACILFEDDLTPAEVTDLTTTVAAHQANE